MADSSRPTETTRPVLGETRARQGRFGRHMVWVLLFGTLLAAIGLFVAWSFKGHDLANSNSNNGPANVESPTGPAPAGTFHAPEPAPLNNPPPANPAASGPR